MAISHYWITLGSKADLPGDMPGLMDWIITDMYPVQTSFINSGYISILDASGRTLNLWGDATEAGFAISYVSLVQIDGQRLISIDHVSGDALVIGDTTAEGILAGLVQAITTLQAGDDVRLGASGGIGSDLVMGGKRSDVLFGGNGDDTVIGGQGKDWVEGGWGRDRLSGWAGDDTLVGGGGADYLTGGRGADTFLFYVASDIRDRISDFSQAEGDVIDLGNAYGQEPGSLNSGFVLSGDENFHAVAGELRLLARSAGTFVQGDIDGDGFADFNLLVLGVTGLEAADFVL